MGVLWKLCWRDLIHRRLRLGFTILAISAVSCLMIWFVGSLDLGSMMKRDTVKKTFGTYSLALFCDDGFSDETLTKLENSPLVERFDRGWQTAPDVRLKGIEQGAVAFRRSPKITGTDRMKIAPYEMEEGRWIETDGECVVSSMAEADLLGALADDSGKKSVLPGDEIVVKMEASEVTLRVVGTFKQTAMKPQMNRFGRGGTPGGAGGSGGNFNTFSFGFGDGLKFSSKKEAITPSPMPSPKNGNERRKAIRGPWSPAGVGLSSGAVYVSLADQRKICDNRGMINIVFVQLKKGKTPTEFFAEAEKTLGKSLAELAIETADAVTLQSQQEQQMSINTVFTQAWSAMGIVIVAAVLIIFTTLNMDVSDRTRYLAMLRTLGLTRTQVAASILLEGTLLGVLGWLLGMLAGWGLLEILAFAEEGKWVWLSLSGKNVALAFVCTLLGAFVASIVPAIRATLVAPVESMVRRSRRFAMKNLFIALLLGINLLQVILLVVFFPMSTNLRGLLFGTLGTLCFGFGFLLIFPWVIMVTEKLGSPILAFVFRFDRRFLKNQLAGNQIRTLMTALIMSLGLGLYTAILIWSSSMLYRFVIQDDAIPFGLVRVDDVITSDEVAEAVRSMPGVDTTRFMEVAVAQPNMDDATMKKMTDGGAQNGSIVVMGIQPELAYNAKGAMLNLRFTEGNRESVWKAMCEAETENHRVCVVTTEIVEHAGLHIGDSIELALPGNPEKPRFARYEIVGVVDFPGMLWFTKFGNVRVGAGRCCALAFAPFEVVQRDFQTPHNEFFWFDTDGKTTHAELQETLQKIVHRESARNFLPDTDAEFEASEYASISSAQEKGLTGFPDVLASLHPGAAGKKAGFAIRSLEYVRSPDDILYVNTARATFRDGGATILYGIDPQIAFRMENPILRLPYTDGNASEALRFLCDDDNTCVITTDFATSRGLKVGDRISLNVPQRASTPSGEPRIGSRREKRELGGGNPDLRGKNIASPTGRGEVASSVDLRIVAIVDLPNWKTLAETTGRRVPKDVQTVIFTTPGALKDDFSVTEYQHFWFQISPTVESPDTVTKAVQDIAKNVARTNRAENALARRNMLRQMSGAQLASVESVNGSLHSRAGNVIGMMTKMPLIMLAISTIAILNTMIVSVFTRRWEMGVLRAYGVTRGGLIRLILAEAVLIGACAIIMSFLFGVFYSWLLIHITSLFGIVTPPLIIPWGKICFGFGLTVFLCVVASIYPAFVAGLREPVELLRTSQSP